ncbi:pyridoxine/pyridoxamine 5'-phosphate oxidase [Bacterioplanes sanyensis]|uniref:pyridoxamine 5'-phosphate oxidase n=1 Tax=Bacterioplanes sanyensis TaxID=1249553 RepID=UPI001674E2C3|nr:pyridoxamine 5'-phosphate oxidase [Bacterioplanes sanyensis]GGY42523.1 pyridoxine/pyridoxamine 5'-phosphate oxidase [Bacterioplanes sanyensis]
MVDLWDVRREYTQGRLDEATAAADPLTQFHAWFEDYRASDPLEPNIMTVATVDAQGQPWQRVLLLKAYDPQGFVFFTNYDSHKGQHLGDDGLACLHFFWLEKERQVQIQGRVEKLPRSDSEQYFHSRPRDSQLGAWASQQSRPIADRAALEQSFEAVRERFEGQQVPLPDYWGGYRVRPQRMEFWQGGAHRLHDRLEYVQNGEQWVKQRLNP